MAGYIGEANEKKGGIIEGGRDIRGIGFGARSLDYKLSTHVGSVSRRKSPVPKGIQTALQELDQYGTGVLISKEGFILTCNHVVTGADLVRIILYNSESRTAEVVARDKEHDIALLRVGGAVAAACSFNSNASPAIGSDVTTVGFPNPEVHGFAPKTTKGKITKLSGFNDEPYQFESDLPIKQGNSWGRRAR